MNLRFGGLSARNLIDNKGLALYPIQMSVISSNSINAASALRSKFSALENARKTAARIRSLPDGRIRYYGAEIPARKPGPARGASYVTEYNLETGRVRSWMESYSHAGDVTRVHLKMIDGQSVIVQHYPPTYRESGL